MQIGYLKGFKPNLIKQIVLLVGICYLINPLQNQITSVLHSISHGIEMPQTLLSHDENNDQLNNLHKHHNHDNSKSEHDHQFIDLVDSVFEASNEEGNSEEIPVNKVKVKKHITSVSINLPLKYDFKVSKEYFTFVSRLKEGYPKKLEFPPNHFLS